MYRPEGWKNPYKMEKIPNGKQWGYTNAGYTEEFDSFEAGADAMLEALQSEFKVDVLEGSLIGILNPPHILDLYPRGNLVFIPEEKDA